MFIREADRWQLRAAESAMNDIFLGDHLMFLNVQGPLAKNQPMICVKVIALDPVKDTESDTVLYINVGYEHISGAHLNEEGLEQIGLHDLSQTDSYLVGKPYYTGKFQNIPPRGNLFRPLRLDDEMQTIADVKEQVKANYLTNRMQLGQNQIYKVRLKKVYMVLDAQFQIVVCKAMRNEKLLLLEAHWLVIVTFNQQHGLIIEDRLRKQKHYIDQNIFNS